MTLLRRAVVRQCWDSRPTDSELARIAGVSPSQVAHWRDGSDTMCGYHLEALAAELGAEVVLGTTARPMAGRPLETIAELGTWFQRLLGHAIDATADGQWDPTEAAEARGLLLSLRTVIDQLDGQLTRLIRRSS